MIAIREHAEGWVLAVRVQAAARKAGVRGEQAGALKVAVAAPPQDGRANQAVSTLLSDVLHVKRSQVELLHGATERNKRFLVRGISRPELEARLAGLLSG